MALDMVAHIAYLVYMGNTQVPDSGPSKLGWSLESEWLDPFRWARKPTVEAVTHRDHVYPARFTASWVRDDGLCVDLDIAVDADRGPVTLSATISGPDGIEGEYRQPIPSMTRQAAAEIAWVETGERTISPAPAGPIPMASPTVRTDRQRLEKVADLYRQAVSEGVEVGPHVAAGMYVSKKTAYGLIRRARAAGLLPPSKPGRKGQK
jgi:hypothetical protein